MTLPATLPELLQQPEPRDPIQAARLGRGQSRRGGESRGERRACPVPGARLEGSGAGPDSEESVQLRHPASCRAACSTPAAFTCPGREQTAEISWTGATSASRSLPRVPGSLLLLMAGAPRGQTAGRSHQQARGAPESTEVSLLCVLGWES